MQSSLNVEKIRRDFPIFKNNPDLIFLDNASTTQKPQSVIDTLTYYYENYNSNIHRGIYQIAEKATAAYEKTRKKAAHFIGAKETRSGGRVFPDPESEFRSGFAVERKNSASDRKSFRSRAERHPLRASKNPAPVQKFRFSH